MCALIMTPAVLQTQDNDGVGFLTGSPQDVYKRLNMKIANVMFAYFHNNMTAEEVKLVFHDK